MRRLTSVLSLLSCSLALVAAGQEDQPKKPRPLQNPKAKTAMTIEKTSFGKTKDGTEIQLFTCKNSGGLVLKVMTYGATVVSMETPDKLGNVRNIQLGFPKLDGYLARHPYFGSTVGRYGNRIAGGKFTLDGKEFKLATNNGPNHLHGGIKGFDAVVWKAEEVKTADAVGVKFSYTSKDGEEGYPGTLQVTATYTLTSANEMRIDYTATTDKPTVLNLTNHCYWNLGGAGSGKILEHQLTINADKYLPIDATSIPTGELADVKGTAMDFTTPHAIGERIEELKKPPHQTKGYDHCYVLRGQEGKLALAAKAVDPASGRTMEIHTTEPGVQLYCGNFLDGGEGGGGYGQHDAFCLETQHFPDSPNQPKFPSTVLKPGQTFKSTTVHKFGVQK
jgi:aldose 1-epimerase